MGERPGGSSRRTFDEDEEAYDRTRPVAPERVFDDIVELAGLQAGWSIVEIGPGTGQATRPFAERGLRILALELGPHLHELDTTWRRSPTSRC
jgi:hypothetical protein